jgi:hypothetical protein
MSAVSINRKDNKKFDITFSKYVKGKLFKDIRKTFCCHPSSRASSGPLFVMVFLYGYITMGGHIVLEAQKEDISVMDAFARPLLIS